jgi:hypothetical protein
MRQQDGKMIPGTPVNIRLVPKPDWFLHSTCFAINLTVVPFRPFLSENREKTHFCIFL